MLNSAGTIINEAIAMIDAFVDGTSNGKVGIAPARFRELSHCIERAKSARILRPQLLSADRSFSALCTRYQRSLKRLQIRLLEIEASLAGERNRLLDDEFQLTRMRRWNTSLSRTQ